MKDTEFVNYLNCGRTICHTYERAPLCGLIHIWKYNDQFILTWEEFEEEHMYDESEYTRDVHLKFDDAESILKYLNDNELSEEDFMVN